MHHQDTLPTYQTISIVNVFLLITSVSMVTYAVMDTSWLRQDLTIRTFSLGKLLNETLPNRADTLLPSEDPKECSLIRKVKAEFLRYQNGKIAINMQMGLNDICLYLQLKGYSSSFDENFPAFYTCKSIRDLTNGFGSHMKHFEEEDVRPFDECIDVLNEMVDLTTLGISFSIAAFTFALMKTPLIRNIFKSRKIFTALTILCVFSVVVTYSWAIGLFAMSFKPEQVLRAEQQRAIDKNNSFSKFWAQNTVRKQKIGKCFYLLVAADVVTLVVLILSFVEFKLSRVVNRGDDEFRMSQEKLLPLDS